MTVRFVSLLSLFAVAVAGPGSAQRPAACQSVEHRQFDFWVGTWDVFDPRGNRVGANTIATIENGCALHEHWEGASGSTGQSFNIYDARTGRWHQTWVSSNGMLLQLDGNLDVEGRMVLRGSTPAQADGTILHDVTWTPVARDSVRQVWRQSRDGGTGWNVVFDGMYVRRRTDRT